jgi:FkbM family methyltransferase
VVITLPEPELAARDSAAWYARRVAEEIEDGEPELGLLPILVRPGSLALDVGANLGIYAFALAQRAGRVEAFEPNPAVAAIAGRMLGSHATVRVQAASDEAGGRVFRVPLSASGDVLHFSGNLGGAHDQFSRHQEYQVEAVTLDSFGYQDVSLLKVDAEGHEREVLLGARDLLRRCRPFLIVELLSGTHADPAAEMAFIRDQFGYQAFVLHGSRLVEAAEVLRDLPGNSTWGTAYRTRNMLFVPAG